MNDKFIAYINHIKNAAQKHLTEIPKEQRKEYISTETWNMIKERDKEHKAANHDKVKELTTKIKKSADKDKTEFSKNKLEQMADVRTNWKHIKEEKQKFAPRLPESSHVFSRLPPLLASSASSRLPTSSRVFASSDVFWRLRVFPRPHVLEWFL